MSNKPNVLLEALALILCISALVVTTHSLGNLDLALPDVQRCLSPILDVPGCLNELIDADLRLEPRLLGPPCCNAFLQINQYCWDKLFPMSPGFAPSLKDYCLGLPPPLPPPNTPGAPPAPILLPQTPPPSIPQTPPPQSPHKPSPPQSPQTPPTKSPDKPSPLASPRKSPSSSPNTLPPQSPHKPPLPSSPSPSPSKPPSHSPTPASPHTPPSASPQKTPPVICTSYVDIDDLSEEWDVE